MLNTTICVEWCDVIESLNKEVKRKFTLTIPSDVNVFEFGNELKKIMLIIGYHPDSIKQCFNEIEDEI